MIRLIIEKLLNKINRIQMIDPFFSSYLRKFDLFASRYLFVNSAHVDSKVNKTVGVSPLVIIPGDNLVEGVVERNAC
jgi:hypothetical protein